ncbi:MAG TPA: class I SAM-dependent methyltransferase [Desulfovibrio sp.]|uniref:class I SAM-dependent methyltransferase n=1 Tax=Desulfovibrio sp. TaxID=885 RepID=UPI002CFFDDD3|nr:class I SAM-dependent methyltransferase [Desulfovibrio sp.]HMM38433.1 class I SAM-dependent methyltransferase [Desulfovibrio sp.]
MNESKVKNIYQDAFRQYGRSREAILWPKGCQAERFATLTAPIPRTKKGFSVLDYGCGFADLKTYLDEHFEGVSYTGVDIVPEFIEQCRKEHPDGNFILLEQGQDVPGEYDYTFIVGVFNLQYLPGLEENRRFVYSVLERLFRQTKIMLGVNMLTDQVDFMKEGAYHQNAPHLYEHARKNWSRRLILNQSTFPYEFFLMLFQNREIIPGTSIYDDPDGTCAG